MAGRSLSAGIAGLLAWIYLASSTPSCCFFMSRLRFRIEAEASGSRARAGHFTALHGEVQTPVFMPVGTRATVRGQTVETLEEAGSQVVLANTYHLLLRPGPEIFRQFGGIHRFMNWKRPVLTDSGGFQIFCLPHARKMQEEGASFQSYLDGRRILLSPELSIDMQKAIGSDIMMVLDQCIPSTAERTEAEAAMHLTHRWALRSLAARGDSPQALFAITQGACFEDLRKQSAETLCALPFDGFAIGGLAVGESKAQREDMTEHATALLPRNLPRYLMGVGMPIDLLEAVHRGVDMFDCIIPNALAQQGVVFTSTGKMELRRGVFRDREEALDERCPCRTCKNYSRAYLHHLIKSGEVLAWQLLGNHNLHYYHRLMAEMRAAILNDSFAAYYQEKRVELEAREPTHPIHPPIARRRTQKHALHLGDYEVQLSPEGYGAIRQISSGEVMHSVNQPEEEAQRLYVQQSRLEERLLEEGEPLVIWDVGLGAATNAMAAISAVPTEQRRKLHMVSFENNLDSLRLALRHPLYFAHLRHAAPNTILKQKRWESKDGKVTWELREGDFGETMVGAAHPDLIFYDPFSFKADSALWTPAFFERLRGHCGEKSTELYTYSASTAVRAALLAAGFFVGKGVGTGPKADTTVAFTRSAAALGRFVLLDTEWLRRWERSGARVPPSILAGSKEGIVAFELAIRSHPQFAGRQS
jgi:queuine tRNA-ribosyltransferase